METARLRIAELAPEPPSAFPSHRFRSIAFGAALIALAALATRLGADLARRPDPSTEDAGAIVRTAFQSGIEAPEVRRATQSLRGEIGSRPLEARTRVLYAGVLADLAQNADDLAAAAFHARRAANLAPVTVPVVRSAALVLVRAGQPEAALALSAAMFSYDPASAAKLLALLEPYVEPASLRSGISGEPGAFYAWIEQLRRQGRRDEANAWLNEAHGRWPTHRALLDAVAAQAVARKDWDALSAALTEASTLPEEPLYATLFAYRSRLESARGDLLRARIDAATAVRLAGARPAWLMVAGDAMEAATDTDGAKAAWSRAQYSLPAGARNPLRSELLARLARLEERRGRLGDALRDWRELLENDPAHAEAQKGVARLTGASPPA